MQLMKHFPQFFFGAAGIVAFGWNMPALAQPGTLPRLNPGVSVPPAAAPAFPGTGSASPNAVRPAQSGSVFVAHALVTATDDVKVPARDAGTIIHLAVKGGEIVNAEFVLGQIDNRDTLAKQRIAQGEYDAALAQYNSKAEIEAAKKGYEVANAEWENAKDIRAKSPGAISTQEYRRAEFQAQRAWAQIQVAETDNLVAGLTAKMKKAQLDATDIELSKKKIDAPIQGQVVEVYKHRGEWVQPGDAVLRLVRLDKVRVEGFVYASEAGRNDIDGKPVSVKVYLPGQNQDGTAKTTVVNGRVDFVSPVIEGSGRNRQYRIWTEVENPDFVIQPGASAEMTINTLAAKIPAPAAEAPAAAPALNGFNGPRTEGPAAEESKVEALKPATEEKPMPAAAVPTAPAAAPAAAQPMTPAAAPATPAVRPAAAAPATPAATTPAVRPATTTATPAARPAAAPATPKTNTAPRTTTQPR